MTSAADPPLEVALELAPEEAFALAVSAVEEWGGEVEEKALSSQRGPARVQLPVSAGLRFGWVDAHLSTRAVGSGSQVLLHVENRHYRLHRSAVMVLLLGGLAGLSMLVMPLYPPLLDLLPLAALLLVLAWFMVASKVRHQNAQDFLDELSKEARMLAAEDSADED